MKIRSELCPCGGMHAPWRCPKIAVPIQGVKESFFGPSASIFVGRIGYPNVFVGPMGALVDDSDTPSKWFGMKYSDIISLRFSTIRSKEMHGIHNKSRLVSDMQDIVLAKRPTDVEMLFKKKPSYRMAFSSVTQPMGPSAELQKLTLAENPKISRKIERIVGDDLKAAEAATMLFGETDVYQITNILSSGVLGIRKKLVPTRWSITAVDDILCKGMLEKIRQFPHVKDYLVFSSYFLHNSFDILMMPGSFEYENFESSPEDGLIVEEYEPFTGRKAYAEKEGGGYYAARLAVCEALKRMGKQARVIVFREIGRGYSVPLGVWVVRETARNTMRQKPARFSTLKEATEFLKKRLSISFDEYAKRSIVLRQRRLTDFSNPF